MDLSTQQIEARVEGTQKSTVRFLTNNHLIAIIVFVIAIVTANLWTQAIISIATNIMDINREQMNTIQWIMVAAIFTLIAYFLIVYIFRIPITAAFSF